MRKTDIAMLSRMNNVRANVVKMKLALFASLLLCASHAFADVVEVDNAALKSLIEQGVPVVDVRRDDEWQKGGVIQGAHLLTFFDKRGRYDAKKWLAELEKITATDEPFVLICEHGVRSKTISNLLDKRLGYTQVHNVTDGMHSWVKSGAPVVKPLENNAEVSKPAAIQSDSQSQ